MRLCNDLSPAARLAIFTICREAFALTQIRLASNGRHSPDPLGLLIMTLIELLQPLLLLLLASLSANLELSRQVDLLVASNFGAARSVRSVKFRLLQLIVHSVDYRSEQSSHLL